MVDDHGKAGKRLNDIAVQKSATLPVGVSDEQQKHIERLSALSGPEFDRAYIELMVSAHKADLKAFKRGHAEDSQDPDLKAFAADMVPMIQEHLAAAEAIDQHLKSGMSLNQ